MVQLTTQAIITLGIIVVALISPTRVESHLPCHFPRDKPSVPSDAITRKPCIGYSTGSSGPWTNFSVLPHIAAFFSVIKLAFFCPCHLEEEFVGLGIVCENSRSKISKNPRRNLTV